MLRIGVSQRNKALGNRTPKHWSLELELKLRNGASGEHGRSQVTSRTTNVAVER
jgi:hypothetical protein